MRSANGLLCLVLLAAIGCGGGGGIETVDQKKADNGESTNGQNQVDTPTTKRGTIGVSVLTLNNPFFEVIGDNLTAEAAKHGYETIVVSGDQDPNKQLEQVQDFISRGCVAIVLVPCKSEVPAAIKAANAAKVPVFTTDSASLAPDVKIECHIGTDNYGGGKLAGKAMIEALGEGGGKVAILDYPEAESCKLRVKGFTEVINEHNAKDGVAKIEIVEKLDARGDQEEGYKMAQVVIQRYDDLKGIFAINDPSALGAHSALQNAGKESGIKIVGFDGQLEGKIAIRDGKIYADPIQFPDKMGVLTAQTIVKFFKGEEIPPEILIPTALYRKADGEQDESLPKSPDS